MAEKGYVSMITESFPPKASYSLLKSKFLKISFC